jgi:hypothetical protein
VLSKKEKQVVVKGGNGRNFASEVMYKLLLLLCKELILSMMLFCMGAKYFPLH